MVASHTEGAFAPTGTEYSVSGPLAGDQLSSQVVLTESGGIAVWQDNATDGDGLGISAQRLDANFSPMFGVFRVNQIGEGDQENPQAARLKNGNTVFVWQGGAMGFQKIFARFMDANGIFIGGDLQVNSYTNEFQINPVLAPLANGNVVVVWSSYGQDGDMQGVFGQILSPVGGKIGMEFQLNDYNFYNQRTPTVAAFPNGGFVAAWISEQQRFIRSVDVFARQFSDQGLPLGEEFVVNSATNVCASPAVAVASDSTFLVVWAQDFGRLTPSTNQVDIMGRVFTAQGAPVTDAIRVNSYEPRDQYAPRVCVRGSDYFVVWTSDVQDGSLEGVYGQFLSANGTKLGPECRLNTVAMGRQLNPTVATDGQSRFLAVWSSYNGLNSGMDLFGQVYSTDRPLELPTPSAPMVSALSQSRMSVTWPFLAGYDVAAYELLLDGQSVLAAGTKNYYVASSFAPNSTHSFQLRYRLQDGRVSLFSSATLGPTWGEDLNGDGLPDNWQERYWGPKDYRWPASKVDSDGDGMSNYQEFLAGTDPTDPHSLLCTRILATSQGARLSWNGQPGFIYQVQISFDCRQWQDWGAPRFAAETVDSVPLQTGGETVYYRIVRIR